MPTIQPLPGDSDLLYFLELYDLSEDPAQDRKRPKNPLTFRHEKHAAPRKKLRQRRPLPAELE